ncbi:MAG: peroxidase-related enzyme, partial [Terriglobales bacterium]
IAHGAILRVYAKNPLIADQVAIHHRKADITPRQKAMLDFACKLARTPEAVVESDHELLRSHGFGAEDIWDIGAITALFALSNRMAHLIDMRANDEFYLLGRVAPPAK